MLVLRERMVCVGLAPLDVKPCKETSREILLRKNIKKREARASARSRCVL